MRNVSSFTTALRSTLLVSSALFLAAGSQAALAQDADATTEASDSDGETGARADFDPVLVPYVGSVAPVAGSPIQLRGPTIVAAPEPEILIADRASISVVE